MTNDFPNTPAIRAPGRETGLERLSAFLPAAGRTYADTRNYDLGPEDRTNVSCLSPYLRRRLILEQEVIDAVLERHAFKGAEKFIQEVFWRTYFKGWLEQHPSVWTTYCRDVTALHRRLETDVSLSGRYREAIEGGTGIDCFDYWAAELPETGYLHNHARMWFASIWIFTLGLPWQLGAEFFLRHLLDGDPASNTLGWRWVAGLHTKGKNYEARSSNIAKYTNGRFDPSHKLTSNPAPLAEESVHDLVPLPQTGVAPTDEPYGLLITEEDCAPESLELNAPPVGLLGLSAVKSDEGISDKVLAFNKTSVADAVGRGGEYFDCPDGHQTTEEWSEAIRAWASDLNVKTVVTPYAPVGPTATRLNKVCEDLQARDIRIIRLLRAYDAVSWPHATKGFFGLKAKIPKILDRLQNGQARLL